MALEHFIASGARLYCGSTDKMYFTDYSRYCLHGGHHMLLLGAQQPQVQQEAAEAAASSASPSRRIWALFGRG